MKLIRADRMLYETGTKAEGPSADGAQRVQWYSTSP
jgi:hypothetical protein